MMREKNTVNLVAFWLNAKASRKKLHKSWRVYVPEIGELQSEREMEQVKREGMDLVYCSLPSPELLYRVG